MSLKNIIQEVKRFFCRSGSKTKITGTIKFFDRKKRFGFIVAGSQEYFFHAAATKPGDFKALQDGVTVTFNVVEGKKGPQADNIDIVLKG
jgi:CspA family cold shock protein